MKVEPWAQLVIARELQQVVHIHDDQSQPGMYDLRVGSRAEPLVAIECVRAVDATLAAFWNAGPARGPLQTDLQGNWILVLQPTAQVRALRGSVLGDILRPWDGHGTTNIYVDWRLERVNSVLFNKLRRLGIASLHCVRQAGSGKVFLNPEDVGGIVDEHGTVIAEWISKFLRAGSQADIIAKLARAGCNDCHVFVPVDWNGAPWDVESYLISGLENMPDGTPDLPPPVTSAWIVSFSSPEGIRWDGTRWRKFDARADQAQ
jgi:hypothetical protein